MKCQRASRAGTIYVYLHDLVCEILHDYRTSQPNCPHNQMINPSAHTHYTVITIKETLNESFRISMVRTSK